MFNADSILLKLQDSVQPAQAARKIVVADGGILQLQRALQLRLRHCPPGDQMQAEHSAGKELGVHGLKQRHIDRAFQLKIYLARLRQLRLPVRREIRSTPR